MKLGKKIKQIQMQSGSQAIRVHSLMKTQNFVISMACPPGRPREPTVTSNSCLKKVQDPDGSSGSLIPPTFPLTTLLPKREMPHTARLDHPVPSDTFQKVQSQGHSFI